MREWFRAANKSVVVLLVFAVVAFGWATMGWVRSLTLESHRAIVSRVETETVRVGVRMWPSRTLIVRWTDRTANVGGVSRTTRIEDAVTFGIGRGEEIDIRVDPAKPQNGSLSGVRGFLLVVFCGALIPIAFLISRPRRAGDEA